MGGEKSRHPVGESLCEGEKLLSAREMKVMAALARRPFGLRSIADIARASGVPPTTAGRILRRLQDDDLVRLHRRMLADWGRAKEGTVWVLTVSPRVLRMLPALSQIELPDPLANRPPPRKVPHRFWHHFWNANPRKLALPEDAHYVADRLILSSDPAAWGWALINLPVDSLARVAESRGADPRTRSMIRNFISART